MTRGSRAWIGLAMLLGASALAGWTLPRGALDWQPVLALREPWAELGGQAFQIMSKLIHERASLSVGDIPERTRAAVPGVIDALRACFSYEPAGRPTAMAVYDVLDEALEAL